MDQNKKSFVANLSDMMPVLLETIESGGVFRMVTAGISMLPLLRNRKDTVVLKKPSFPLKQYDIPLYLRADGHFILHRVLKVESDLSENIYTMCGDNQLYMEHGVTDKDVIAVVDHIIRNDKVILKNSFSYKLYVFLWCRCFFIRFFVLKAKSLFKRIFKKVKREH